MLVLQYERLLFITFAISLAMVCLYSSDVLPSGTAPAFDTYQRLQNSSVGSVNLSLSKTLNTTYSLREECDILSEKYNLKNIRSIDAHDCERVQVACGVKSCHKAVVDAVVLWVNGSDSAWNAEYNSALRYADAMTGGLQQQANKANLNDGVIENRFRDFGQLKYCLRSMEMYGPWIRRIFIVTDEQWPNYLLPADDTLRLRYVNQHQLFDYYFDAKEPSMKAAGRLHNYNSMTLEYILPFIPSLGSEYIYFNDDMALLNPVPLSRLYDESTQKGIMQMWIGYQPNFATTWGFNTVRNWAQEMYPGRECIRPRSDNGTVDEEHCLQPAHGPKFIFKEPFMHAWDTIGETMKVILYHPFRVANFDPNPWAFLSMIGIPSHYTYALDEDHLLWGTLLSKEYQNNYEWSMQNLLQDKKSMFVCMNDDFDGKVDEEVVSYIIDSYEKKYPVKASFEI